MNLVSATTTIQHCATIKALLLIGSGGIKLHFGADFKRGPILREHQVHFVKSANLR
jgi:hypothetical protein